MKLTGSHDFWEQLTQKKDEIVKLHASQGSREVYYTNSNNQWYVPQKDIFEWKYEVQLCDRVLNEDIVDLRKMLFRSPVLATRGWAWYLYVPKGAVYAEFPQQVPVTYHNYVKKFVPGSDGEVEFRDEVRESFISENVPYLISLQTGKMVELPMRLRIDGIEEVADDVVIQTLTVFLEGQKVDPNSLWQAIRADLDEVGNELALNEHQGVKFEYDVRGIWRVKSKGTGGRVPTAEYLMSLQSCRHVGSKSEG